MSSPFVHLEVRSYFSLKEGAFSPEDLARRARELGMPAVALTDRDGLYGAARFVAACQREGVRPILGATLTVRGEAARPSRSRSPRGRAGAAERGLGGDRPAERRPPSSRDEGEVVLLAMDGEGYAELCRLITDAHTAVGERRDPWLTPEQICAHARGLACLLGPASPPGRLAASGRPAAARRAAEPFREAFGERLWVAVQHRMEPGSGAEIRALLRLAEALGVRAVATNGVRYLVPGDAFLADALDCMRRLVPLNPWNVRRVNAEGYLKPAEAMRMLFAERPDLCDATLELAEACRFDLGLRRPRFPTFEGEGGRSATSVLAERCWRGLERRGMRPTREVRDRLDLELGTIHRLGYSAYFLAVADIVADIRAMGIACACRGSAASSLVCYLTGISDVDPLRHGLLFERFVNPLRDELPDIDIDVESARREDVYDMILSRHGDDRAACVAMVETYRARAAIREVGKALGLPEAEVDAVAKAFPRIGAGDIGRAIELLPELAGSNLRAAELELLFRVAERLDGFPRHLALHPSGIVLSRDDLVRTVPLERSFQGHRMVQADKDDVELLGFLKLDVLGVRMLSAIRHALDEIARTEGVKVDLGEVPLDDPAAFELIRASDTLGCFQIESPGQRELLQKLQPERFEDLIVDISLFRPGPVKSDMVTPYLRRRAGMERPTYAHPALREVLGETFGVIVYHEQVMRTLAAVGGYPLAEADRIRRHLDDGEEVEAIRRDFLRRAARRGLDAASAERVWREVASFASFGFCKAHAAAFAVPTYRSAWLKARFPAQFLAGVLTHEPGMYPRRLILDDARRRGIEILPLDVNRSERGYVVEVLEEGPRRRYGIRLALADVDGISEAEIRRILEARAERPFRDVDDFLRRSGVSRPVAEALAHAGAFDGVGGGGTRRDRLYRAMTTRPGRAGDQLELDLWGSGGTRAGAPEGAGGSAERGLGGDRPAERRPPAPPGWSFPDYTDAERVRAELEVLGLDATRHLASFFEPLLDDLGVVRARDLPRHRGGEWVMVAGVKVASQTPAVRSGQRIVFLSLDDGTGVTEVTVFERTLAKVARTVFHAYAMAVWGRLRRTGVRGVGIIAEDVWDLAALHRARRDGRLARALHERAAPGLPPRKLWHASPGSAGW